MYGWRRRKLVFCVKDDNKVDVNGCFGTLWRFCSIFSFVGTYFVCWVRKKKKRVVISIFQTNSFRQVTRSKENGLKKRAHIEKWWEIVPKPIKIIKFIWIIAKNCRICPFSYIRRRPKVIKPTKTLCRNH